MSTKLLDLEDRIITDTGSMVAKHELLVKLALAAEPFDHLPFVAHSDSIWYHKDNPNAKGWKSNGKPTVPAESTFVWNIPEPYNDMDILEHLMSCLIDMGLDQNEEYLDRIDEEMKRVAEKEMEDFIRCLVWITDTLRENNKVWGLGRGSSCASLILFVLGVNKVDPVRYDIPMEEFYK